MNREILIILTCLLVSLSASTAFGETGFYVSGRAGSASLEDVELDTTNVDFDTGFFASGAVGYEVPRGRLEAEIAYRENQISEIVLEKGQTFDPGGEFTSLSFMVNSIADYDLGGGWSPYIFVGAGAARISFNEDLNLGIDFDDTEDLFWALQAGAGIEYSVTKAISLDLEYRYFEALDTKFDTTAGGEIDFDYEVHNASLGVRFAF